MSEERRRKQITRLVQEANQSASRPKWGTLVTSALGIIIAGSISLHIAGPHVTPKGPYIDCAICDDSKLIQPPKSPHDNGANFNIAFENSGALGTTILSHNLSLHLDEELPSERAERMELPGESDSIAISLGSHSQFTLSSATNEAIIYEMRHGLPMGSSWGKIQRTPCTLYGHVTYRNAFYLPTTTTFCFSYLPPNKGLPERWVVCPK